MTTTSDGHGDEHLAPVTFLPGVTPAAAPRRETPRRAASLPDRPRRPVTFTEEYGDDEPVAPEPAEVGLAAAEFATAEFATAEFATAEFAAAEPELPAEPVEPELDREALVESASTKLTRSLGRRGRSVAEARAKLRADGLNDDETAQVVEDFVQRGWLDDAALAEQLVYAATTRKDMGTRAVRQLLVKRLVNREVLDAVIAGLPDDDTERALEFARTKARALTRYDDATATRRLMGMLARRGFGGSAAGQAARTALEEEGRQAGASEVRFR